MKISNLKIFEKYRAGDLNENERSDFEENLKLDTELKSQWDHFNDVLDALELNENERISEVVQNTLKPNVKVIKIAPIWYVAASIALIAVVTILLWPKQQNVLFEEYFNPYEETHTHLGYKEDIDKCIENYNSKEYGKAIDCLKISDQNSNTHFYIGMAHMNTRQYEKAIKELKTVQSLNNKKLDESAWYLALCYINSNKNELAKNELNKLINNRLSNYKKISAKEILEKI